jgi:hypothetical protein
VAARAAAERRVAPAAARFTEQGTLVSVAGEGYTDWVSVRALASGGPITTDALVAITRVRDDGTIESSRIGGTYVRVDGPALDGMRAFTATASRSSR